MGIALHGTVTDEEKQLWWLIMDFYTGGDLFDLIGAKTYHPGKLSEKILARYIFEVVSGIRYIHAHRFCHRDVKVGPSEFFSITYALGFYRSTKPIAPSPRTI